MLATFKESSRRMRLLQGYLAAVVLNYLTDEAGQNFTTEGGQNFTTE